MGRGSVVAVGWIALVLVGFSQNEAWQSVLARASVAVVQVISERDGRSTCGTGVVVSSDGYILTAAHVVENARSILVITNHGNFQAQVVKAHDWMDLALLQIEASELPSLSFTSTANLRDGTPVWVLGYVNCGTELLIVPGQVGKTDQNLPMGTVWYDALTYKGQSGGPVVDNKGRILGIHFERPAAEGGGRAVAAEIAMQMIPLDIPFHFSSNDNSITVQWVLVSEPVEQGDVLAIGLTSLGFYQRAHGLSSNVAGVAFSSPGISYSGNEKGKVLLATQGIVPVKVIDEGGPIQVGDLLVVSSTPGYAMRWDPDPSFTCTLPLAKALGSLDADTGVVMGLLLQKRKCK